MPALTDQFVLNCLPILDSDALRVCLALTMLPPRGAELSRTDLCLRAGLAESLLNNALRSLTLHDLLDRGAGVVKGVEKMKLSQKVDGTERQFKLLPAGEASDTIAALQKDKAALTARLRRAEDSSDLPDSLNLEEGNVARLVEQVLGRAMTLEEAYRLGTMIQGYGPERVKAAVIARKKTTNPLYSAAAMLFNGARGAPAAKKETARPVTYFTPSEDFHPWK
jgi:hypothetical protein